MRFFKPFFAAIVLVAAVGVAPAMAQPRTQGASVIVLNYERIIGTADVGRDMTTKLNAIGQQMQAELQPEATAIEQEQQRIQTATRGQTQEQLRNNAQVTAFAQRYEAFRTRQMSMGRDLEYTRQFTLNDFNQQITPIVREVMEARGAGVVLDASATQLVLPNFDATDDVIQRLNQRLRTMNVARQTAPAPQQPAAPQQ
jgi:Skp family chaperone for outer membrane proteins